MTDHLNSVKRAARAKSRADAHYKAAVLDALASGETYAAIAGAVGLTRQAVRQLAQRL